MNEQFKNEFTDVILTTLLLDKSVDIDIEEALTKKMKKLTEDIR